MAGIFISYRRKEGQAHARLIFQHLCRSPRFWGRVFMDVDGLKPGENFRDKIGKQLDGCTVLLALIGVQWAQLRDEHGVVRLRDERDWVRLEIETALKRGITVVPVLIDGARMPVEGELPSGLHPLLERHAFTLDLAQRFDPGMSELEAAIRPYMPFPGWAQLVLAGVVLGGAGGGYVAQRPAPSVVRAEPAPVLAAPAPAAAPSKPLPPQPGDTLPKDCTDCPELVLLPKGSFVMGSPDSEKDRDNDEGPNRTVQISKSIAVGRYEVTRGEFAKFVTESQYKTEAERSNGCAAWDGKEWKYDAARHWRDPGFKQADDHPVVCVSWNDTQEYLKWLNKKAPGKNFRLLSEVEWEYAARAGQGAKRFPWRDDVDYTKMCAFANGADETAKAQVPGAGGWSIAKCADGYAYTAPVTALQANAFGLKHMHGNAWEWVEDVWHDNYTGAPTDGTAWKSGGDSARRVLRGGSWDDFPGNLRSASRDGNASDVRDVSSGFRIARTFSL